MDNQYNEVFPSFNPLNPEFATGERIIDFFSSHFSFHSFNKHNNNSLVFWSCQLDSLALSFLENHTHAFIIINISIKNNVATSIAHVHICDKPVVKTLHHAVNISSTKAKLFTIRCGINQAINFISIHKIIVVTDSIHTVKKIFESSLHLFQIHSVVILQELCKFFLTHQENSIKFWECPSHYNWLLYKVVDNESKSFNPVSLFLYKSS